MSAERCRWCDMIHGVKCPAVRAFEFHPDGSIKRVEFMTPADYAAPIMAPPTTSLPNYPSLTIGPNTSGPMAGSIK